MSLDRPNLAGAFTKQPPVDRAAVLSGLLPPARPATTKPPERQDPEEDTPARASLTAVETPSSTPARSSEEPTRRRAPAARRPVSEQASVVTNVAVYLEPDLLELARQRRRTTGMSYDELTVEAFDAISDDQLAHALQPEPAVSPTTGMPTRQRRTRGTAGIQIQLRLDTNQRTWIDQKQQAVGAPSRSALVATALRLHLTA